MHQKITAHLWQVAGGELTHSADAAAYLVRFGKHAVLFDAGCGAAHDRLKANIDACLEGGAALDLLLLTHCHYDHTGGAEAVRHDFGCAIAAHELDAVYLENGDSEVTAATWYGAGMDPLSVDVKFSGETNQLRVGDGEITCAGLLVMCMSDL